MKKFFTICLLAVLPILFLSSCSDDDDNASSSMEDLVGAWIEDTTSTKEVFHLTLKADGTGRFYVSNDGKVDENGLINITWFAADNKFTMKKEGGEVESAPYSIKKDRLYIGEIVYRKMK